MLFSSSFDLPLPTPGADTNSKQHSHDLNSAGLKLAKCSHVQRVSAFLEQSLTALHGAVEAHPQTGLSEIGLCAWAHRHLWAHACRAREKNCTYTPIQLTVQPTTCTGDGKCLFSLSPDSLKLRVTIEQKLLIQEELSCESPAEIPDFEFII